MEQINGFFQWYIWISAVSRYVALQQHAHAAYSWGPGCGLWDWTRTVDPRCRELLWLPTEQQTNNIWNVPRWVSLCIPASLQPLTSRSPTFHNGTIETTEQGKPHQEILPDCWTSGASLCLCTEVCPPTSARSQNALFDVVGDFYLWDGQLKTAFQSSLLPRRRLQRGKKREEPGEFTVQVLPFYCGFSPGLTNPPLPCQLQTGWLTAAGKPWA